MPRSDAGQPEALDKAVAAHASMGAGMNPAMNPPVNAGQQPAPYQSMGHMSAMDDEQQSMSDDVIMAFLEGAESRLNFHQAELIRLACQGFTRKRIARAQYVLNRALQLADTRPASISIDDPFNGYIMDFIEEADSLTYHEAEFLRRVSRGCNREDLNEANYLLARARRLQEEESFRSLGR
ncbi:hypothetical protein [Desulfovibrio sp. An276]|uniref:hypothetical protein n=1 Tax=Desulfovibrio sp. An276 TaxID=1965618 RepID=UPI001185653E|nr:hypothetical protein [Desulfovibrio sp. An276]